MNNYTIVQVGYSKKTYYVYQCKHDEIDNNAYIEKFNSKQDALNYINNHIKNTTKSS